MFIFQIDAGKVLTDENKKNIFQKTDNPDSTLLKSLSKTTPELNGVCLGCGAQGGGGGGGYDLFGEIVDLANEYVIYALKPTGLPPWEKSNRLFEALAEYIKVANPEERTSDLKNFFTDIMNHKSNDPNHDGKLDHNDVVLLWNGGYSGGSIVITPLSPGGGGGGGGPICCSPATKIRTNEGEKRIAAIKVGDVVLTDGEKPVRVKEIGKSKVTNHKVLKIILNDGTVLKISPGHPTSDGRKLCDLKVGDILDGRTVIKIKLISYKNKYTYDILSDSETGHYYANGVLLGSTLKTNNLKLERYYRELVIVY